MPRAWWGRKAQDLSIKKLTWGNKTMKERFAEARQREAEGVESED